MRNVVVIVGALVSFAGCSGSQTVPDAPGDASGDAPNRPKLTAAECEAGGGTVVGDIGDGAIHRPEYRCAGGAAPSGTIAAAEGGPIAIEGSVCCPK